MSAHMITTEDNPYDYFNDFENWYNFDIQKGYNTCSLLARIARTSDQLSDDENERKKNREKRRIFIGAHYFDPAGSAHV